MSIATGLLCEAERAGKKLATRAMNYIQKLLDAAMVIPFRKFILVGKSEAAEELRFRNELVEVGRMLHAQGFVAATDGNLSVRMPTDRVMITPTGVSKGMMHPDGMVIVNLQGEKLLGNREPSSEIAMHLTIYRIRPDVGAVVHAHPCTATSFASSAIALDEPVCSEAAMTLGTVPLAPYGTPGTNELSDSLRPFIPGYNAILMANHGVVTYGRDLYQAYLRMEAVEHYAKIALAVRQIGRPHMLNEQQLEKLASARSRYCD